MTIDSLLLAPSNALQTHSNHSQKSFLGRKIGWLPLAPVRAKYQFRCMMVWLGRIGCRCMCQGAQMQVSSQDCASSVLPRTQTVNGKHSYPEEPQACRAQLLFDKKADMV